MTTKSNLTKEQINAHLARIHARLEWIAEREAQAAWVGGFGAHGEFSDEHARLTAETDGLLDQLKSLGGTLPFAPA